MQSSVPDGEGFFHPVISPAHRLSLAQSRRTPDGGAGARGGRVAGFEVGVCVAPTGASGTAPAGLLPPALCPRGFGREPSRISSCRNEPKIHGQPHVHLFFLWAAFPSLCQK